MAAPARSQNRRRVVVDARQPRAASTPPRQHTSRPHHLPNMDQSTHEVTSRHSSPGKHPYCAHIQARELVSRRLTTSPAPVLKIKDRTRRRLAEYTTIDHAVELLKTSRNVIVLTGAGISTSLGIPAFRGDDGFYSRLPASMGTPEDFFSITNFKHNNEEFWRYVKPLLPKHYRSKADGTFYAIDRNSFGPQTFDTVPTPRFSKTHAFVALLQHKRKLLTNYTQNIDGLEFAAGVKDDKVFRCHGSWDRATCLTCGSTTSARKYLPVVHRGDRPTHGCSSKASIQSSANTNSSTKSTKKSKKRKRQEYEGDSDHSSDNGVPTTPPGLYKPNITFFNESLSTEYDERLQQDSGKADLFIIIGTSLKVRPVKTMLIDLPSHVPQIWINKDRFNGSWSDMPGVQVDIELLGECDAVVDELCRRAGWTAELENLAWTPSHASARPMHDQNETHVSQSQQEGDVSLVAELGKHSTSRRDGKTMAGTDLKAGTKPSDLPTIVVEDQSVRPAKQESATTIQIMEDIDAPWRWRFTRWLSRSPSPSPVYLKKDLKHVSATVMKQPAAPSSSSPLSRQASNPIAIREDHSNPASKTNTPSQAV